MRLAQHKSVLTVFGFFALCSVLTGCPEKGAPADKTSAEPERAEPDDEGKADSKDPKDSKKPAAAPAPADDKKPDEEKDKGGW